MSYSTLKLFSISLLLATFCVGASAYVLYEQERVGNEVYDRLLDLKEWDSVVMAEDNLREGEQNGDDLQLRLRSYVLLSEADAITFLSKVESLAAASGVSIRTVELKEEKINDPSFNELAATFSLRGENEAVERTIKLLEVLPYRSHIERLTLTRGELTDALLVLRVSTIK